MAHTNSLFRAMRGTVSPLTESPRNESGREADRRDESRRRRRFALTSGIGAYLARSRHMSAIFPKYNIMYSFVGGTSRAPLLCLPAGLPAGRPGPTRRLAREDRPVLYFRRYSFVAHTDTPPHFIPRLLVSRTKRSFFIEDAERCLFGDAPRSEVSVSVSSRQDRDR